MSEDIYKNVAEAYGTETAIRWERFVSYVSEHYERPELARNILNTFPDLASLLDRMNFEHAEANMITLAPNEEALTTLVKQLQTGFEQSKYRPEPEPTYHFLKKQPDGEWNGSEDNGIRALEDS